MSYLVRRFMGFRANDQYYGHVHGIVYSFFSKMGTYVHLRMANNVVHRSFQFYHVEKSFSIFGVPKLVFFVKQLPKLAFITGAHHFSKVVDHILCTFHNNLHGIPFVCIFNI
jgi:hypothetical protein